MCQTAINQPRMKSTLLQTLSIAVIPITRKAQRTESSLIKRLARSDCSVKVLFKMATILKSPVSCFSLIHCRDK